MRKLKVPGYDTAVGWIFVARSWRDSLPQYRRASVGLYMESEWHATEVAEWRWQAGGTGPEVNPHWYAGTMVMHAQHFDSVEATASIARSVRKALSALDDNRSVYGIPGPLDVCKALESLGAVQGEHDPCASRYVKVANLTPVGMSRWCDIGSEALAAGCVANAIAESEEVARRILRAEMAKSDKHADRLASWLAQGQPVRLCDRAKEPPAEPAHIFDLSAVGV